MVTVVNNTITLVRGDTVEIPVTIRLRSGDEYVPSEGDVIRFALKESYGDNVPVLIRKVLPPLDPEGKEIAKHKRETFDIIDTPVDPLR